MVTIIQENIIDELKYELANFSYKYVYLSIGSKLNTEYTNIRGKDVRSNANYQLVPSFIKEEDQLIIMIDKIKESFDLKEHISYFEKRVGVKSKTILINSYLYEKLINDSFDVLLPKLFDHYVDPDNFVIANYIKFVHAPNLLERESEKVIPLKIKEYLNMFQDKIYSTCFYQWFGYQSVYLYNYLYNEDCFNYLHFSVSDLFELENVIKDFDFIRKEETIVVQNKRLLLFLNEIISINQSCLENEYFVISKLQTQKENKKIIEI